MHPRRAAMTQPLAGHAASLRILVCSHLIVKQRFTPRCLRTACPQMEVEVGKLVEVAQPGAGSWCVHCKWCGNTWEEPRQGVASSVAVCSARERRDESSSLSAVLLASGIVERTKRQWNPKTLQWEARVVYPSVQVAVAVPPEPLARELLRGAWYLARGQE